MLGLTTPLNSTNLKIEHFNSQIFVVLKFSKNFTFDEVSVLNLNPDAHAKEMRMYDGNPYPFGLDPVRARIFKFLFLRLLSNQLINISIMNVFIGLG